MAESTKKPTCTYVSTVLSPETLREYTVSFKYNANGSTYTKSQVDHYDYYWAYEIGTGRTYYDSDGDPNTTKRDYVLWDVPENVTQFLLKVRPVIKYTEKKKEITVYGEWLKTPWKQIIRKNYMPEKAPAPTVTIENYTLTASVTIYDPNATHVKFRIVQDDKTEIHKTDWRSINYNVASFSLTVEAGHRYKAQCIAYNKAYNIHTYEYRDAKDPTMTPVWSEYSSNVNTIPNKVPSGTLTITARTTNSVVLTWGKVDSAESYEIEYSRTRMDMTASGDVQTTESTTNQKVINNLEIGTRWYFRVRAKNAQGESAWSSIEFILLGKPPAAPTTWSSVTVAPTNENVTLFWIHNSSDNSKQRAAELETRVNNQTPYARVLPNTNNTTADDVPEETYNYTLTGNYTDGTVLTWRMRTRGIVDEYGPWSIARTIKYFEPPSLTLSTNTTDTVYAKILTGFPFRISGNASPKTQTPIGWQITITSLSQYTAYDNSGDVLRVNVNDIIFSKYYTIESHTPTFNFTPEDVTLENYARYKVEVTVSMNSGLSASSSFEMQVQYRVRDDYYVVTNTEFDKETLTATISPRCYSSYNGTLLSSVHFTIMRIDYNNRLTKIIDKVENSSFSNVIDPYPNLDYMRYRIILFFMDTGQIEFYDTGFEYVGIKDVVINWNETGLGRIASLSNLDILDPRWIGGMIRLPWNIDVTDTFSPESELVSYIGREYDVAYYGTKVNHSSNISVMIDKEDRETVLALRTVGAWRNNVYVREPSGTGYWAQIEINMSQKHDEPGVPVSLTIKRVEGGV